MIGPMAPHRVVVRKRHPGGNEDIVLEQRPGRDIGAGLELHPRADANVVVHCNAAPDDGLGAELCPFPHVGLIGHDAPRLYARAGQNHGAGADERPIADLGGCRRLARRGRARAQRQWLPDHASVLQPHALAERGPGVHGHPAPTSALSGSPHVLPQQQPGRAVRRLQHACSLRSDCCSASSTRTTRSPASPLERGWAPSRTQLT